MDMNKIELKKIKKSDWSFILELRNKQRKYFFQNNIITPNEHLKYMEKNMENSNFKAWIIKNNDLNLGYVRLLNGELSIVLDEKYQGQGFGTIALSLGIKKCKGKLTALIRTDNPASYNLYTKCGFVQKKLEKNIRFLELERSQ